jgi:hypothetical protein
MAIVCSSGDYAANANAKRWTKYKVDVAEKIFRPVEPLSNNPLTMPYMQKLRLVSW